MSSEDVLKFIRAFSVKTKDETMEKVIKFLDGKKSTIALVLMMGAEVAGIWGAPGKVIQTLTYIGMALGGVGLAHKGKKYMDGQ